MRLLIDPGEPPFWVLGVQPVQVNSGGNIGRVLVLLGQAFFHSRQMDQLKHPAPVDGMLLADSLCRILDGVFHQLKLLHPILHQL